MIKLSIINPRLCVGFAGTVELAAAAIRSIRSLSTLDDILAVLREADGMSRARSGLGNTSRNADCGGRSWTLLGRRRFSLS